MPFPVRPRGCLPRGTEPPPAVIPSGRAWERGFASSDTEPVGGSPRSSAHRARCVSRPWYGLLVGSVARTGVVGNRRAVAVVARSPHVPDSRRGVTSQGSCRSTSVACSRESASRSAWLHGDGLLCSLTPCRELVGCESRRGEMFRLRSPSRAALEVRIFSARCMGVCERAEAKAGEPPRGGAVAQVTRAPHLPQKANPSGLGKPHEGPRDASLAPQGPQNVIAGGLSKADCGQITRRAPSTPPPLAPARSACPCRGTSLRRW